VGLSRWGVRARARQRPRGGARVRAALRADGARDRGPYLSRIGMNYAKFLSTYFEKLDSNGMDVLPLLSPNFTFSVLWSDDAGAHEFAGGWDEFHGYLAQRDPDGQLHHIDVGVR